jgi:threonine dehydrogenase-like Zn-dependent dehydrogenase
VDVALELIGLPLTIQQAIKSLGVLGRAVVVGITDRPIEVETYQDVVGKESELIGASDHLASELPTLIEMARRGVLDLSDVVTRSLPLDALAINEAMDRLERFGDEVRVVITP